MEEEFRQIEGFSNYSISNIGNVKNNNTNKILKYRMFGLYYGVDLYNNNIPTKFYIHILLAEIFIPKIEGKNIVDHIDRNKLNNNLDNLRWTNISGNSRNQIKRKGCSSKYKCVSFDKTKKKWGCKISINNKTKHIGYFNKEEDAALAYNNFVIENNIEGAILNDII
jgi:hypothetical protein